MARCKECDGVNCEADLSRIKAERDKLGQELADAAMEIPCSGRVAERIRILKQKHQEEFELISEERDDLREWKRAAMEVLTSLNLQEVGDELGVKLGHPIAPEILPRIKALKQRRSKLWETLKTIQPVLLKNGIDYTRSTEMSLGCKLCYGYSIFNMETKCVDLNHKPGCPILLIEEVLATTKEKA